MVLGDLSSCGAVRENASQFILVRRHDQISGARACRNVLHLRLSQRVFELTR